MPAGDGGQAHLGHAGEHGVVGYHPHGVADRARASALTLPS